MRRCCIVGGGPAGMVLALLLVRQGVRVTVLEAHEDFDRKFRGGTIHPSVLEIFDQIGLSEALLQLQHSKIYGPTLRAAKHFVQAVRLWSPEDEVSIHYARATI